MTTKDKILAIFVTIGVVAVVAAIAATAPIFLNQGRVAPAIAYDTIQLGMNEGEVLVTYGRKPDCPSNNVGDAKVLLFDTYPQEERCGREITLHQNTDKAWQVVSICGPNKPSQLENLRGLGYEETILESLGEPSSTSIAKDGLTKISSFKNYNLAIVFTARKAIRWCVTKDLPLKYVEEFRSS